MVSAGTTHTLTWSGTLADSRIASATNWNTAYTNRITSLTTTGDFLKEISFNRIKSDYDMLQEDGINLLKNLFQELIKNTSKEELDKINIKDNFIEFIKFLSIKI